MGLGIGLASRLRSWASAGIGRGLGVGSASSEMRSLRIRFRPCGPPLVSAVGRACCGQADCPGLFHAGKYRKLTKY